MQIGSMFISNCNNTLYVSDAILRPSSGALKTVVADSGVWHAARYKANAGILLYLLSVLNSNSNLCKFNPVTLVQPVYTPVYVSFISCRMSNTRGCHYSF
jgi:hypothetical protein